MTDAHDPRLKAERDAVIRLWDEQRTGLPSALDALIDAAITLGAEPLVAALEAISNNYADAAALRAAARAALDATGKEPDHDWHIHTGERPGHYADGHTHLAATGKEEE